MLRNKLSYLHTFIHMGYKVTYLSDGYRPFVIIEYEKRNEIAYFL